MVMVLVVRLGKREQQREATGLKFTDSEAFEKGQQVAERGNKAY